MDRRFNASPPGNLTVLVLCHPENPRFLFQRTRRSLLRMGIAESQIREVLDPPSPQVSAFLDQAPSQCLWILRAGTWSSQKQVSFPPASQTGRPVVAFGQIRDSSWGQHAPVVEQIHWQKLLQLCGGEYGHRELCEDERLAFISVYLDASLAPSLASAMNGAGSWNEVLRLLITKTDGRFVNWPGLHVGFDPRLRVTQIVTSVQRGGAERIALDLHHSWRRKVDLTARLIALGPPSRTEYPYQEGVVQIDSQLNKRDRLNQCVSLLEESGTDVVHTHLLTDAEHTSIALTGIPLLTTVHNMRSGWPLGFDTLNDQAATLVVACSRAVEREFQSTNNRIPSRTVWNGIDHRAFSTTSPSTREAARRFIRDRFGIPQDAVVLVTLANPRPQKRLDRVPGILKTLVELWKSKGRMEPIHWVLAGEASRGNTAASLCLEETNRIITYYGLSDVIHWSGAVENIPEFLCSADALVSPSDYEGLSLAHLEALAAQIPVIATNVGGTGEIGVQTDGLWLVPAAASDTEIANAILKALCQSEKPSGEVVRKNFSLSTMTAGYGRMYEQASQLSYRPQGDGLLLVINNFSVGGAQSSARRLLLALKEQGVNVRAAVLQEEIERPTPGRSVLLSAGIPVLALAPAGRIDPMHAIGPLLASIDRSPPSAVLLWNVIPEYKVLLADTLIGLDLYDVSPGEMNFSSLDRYFKRPRPGLPYLTSQEYGRRLTGAIVKYGGEAALARDVLQTTIHVIPNGVPVPQKRIQRASSQLLSIGTAARINPQKRLEDLLAAIRIAHTRLPPYEVLIAGGVEIGCESYAEELRAMSVGLPIRWIGEFSDTAGFYQSLDLFAMISEPAGCPNASLEAMAAGLPIIATDVGGASEQVEEGINGKLVPARDANAFAEALVFMATHPELRLQMGNESHLLANSKFSIERMVRDYRLALGL